MSTSLLPPELSIWSNLNFVHKTGTNEWHSECPQCGMAGHGTSSGKPNRFIMRGGLRARGWCRRCGYSAFADTGKKIEEHERQKLINEMRRESEMHRQEKERKLEWLRGSGIWLEYTQNMQKSNTEWWEQQGIPRKWQMRFGLGFTPSKSVRTDAGKFSRFPAYTIPIADWDGRIINVQYRLVGAPKEVGKYRGIAGIDPHPFIFNPAWGVAGKSVVVVEGSKKAIVVGILLSNSMSSEYWQVVGLAGDGTFRVVRDALRGANRVYIGLDPGSEKMAEQYAENLGRNAKPIYFPQKPDDWILAGATFSDVRGLLC